MSSPFAPAVPFLPHRRSAYSLQRAGCGCWWDALTGGEHVGDRCERRLTGPRCEETPGCIRPRAHAGDCETEERYG